MFSAGSSVSTASVMRGRVFGLAKFLAGFFLLMTAFAAIRAASADEVPQKRGLEILLPSSIRGKVQAATQPSGEKDRYAALEKLFQEGTLPSLSDHVGWMTGRCYRLGMPSVAQNALLLVDFQESGSSDGPLFPPTPEWRFVTLHHHSHPEADFFDVMDSAKRAEISDYWLRNRNLFNPAVEQNGSWVSNWMDAASGPNAYELRKSGDFLILRGPIRVGNPIFSYCYYFKKVE